jgi:hypothetical protein
MQSFDVHELAPPSPDDIAPELEGGNRPPSGKLKEIPLLEPDEGVGEPLEEDGDDASSPDEDPPPPSSEGAVASSPGVHAPHPLLLEKLPEEDCELPLEPLPPELDEDAGSNPCTSGTLGAAHPAEGPTVPARRSPRTHGSARKEGR